MIKINMGCGKRNFGKDWIHIDAAKYEHIDWHDVTKLPYDDRTVDLIYASHLINYFDSEEIITILKEWKRVLRYSGILRLAMPDFFTMARLYHKNNYDLEDFLGPLFGKMKMNNEKIYHKTAYDYKSIYQLLSNLKFKNIRLWDWKKTEHYQFDDHSQAYLPHMDKINGTLISLNVECNA